MLVHVSERALHLAPFPRSTLRRRSLHFASPLLLPAIPSSPRPPTAPPPLPPHSTSISKSSAYESCAIEPCAMRRGLLRREMVTGEHTSTYRSTYRLHCCNQSRPRLTLFAALPSLFAMASGAVAFRAAFPLSVVRENSAACCPALALFLDIRVALILALQAHNGISGGTRGS